MDWELDSSVSIYTPQLATVKWSIPSLVIFCWTHFSLLGSISKLQVPSIWWPSFTKSSRRHCIFSCAVFLKGWISNQLLYGKTDQPLLLISLQNRPSINGIVVYKLSNVLLLICSTMVERILEEQVLFSPQLATMMRLLLMNMVSKVFFDLSCTWCNIWFNLIFNFPMQLCKGNRNGVISRTCTRL